VWLQTYTQRQHHASIASCGKKNSSKSHLLVPPLPHCEQTVRLAVGTSLGSRSRYSCSAVSAVVTAQWGHQSLPRSCATHATARTAWPGRSQAAICTGVVGDMLLVQQPVWNGGKSLFVCHGTNTHQVTVLSHSEWRRQTPTSNLHATGLSCCYFSNSLNWKWKWSNACRVRVHCNSSSCCQHKKMRKTQFLSILISRQ